jgi:hypothetical protein
MQTALRRLPWTFAPAHAARSVLYASLALSLGGCVEAGWDAAFTDPFEAETYSGPQTCEPEAQFKPSKTWSALVGRADPKLLEIARLEAERDCYKALERRARLRLAELKPPSFQHEPSLQLK